MSEIDLDKDLQDMMNASGGEGDQPAGDDSSGLAGLADDLGSLVDSSGTGSSGSGEKSEEAGADAFSLDDEMKSMMAESPGSSGGGSGKKGVMPASAFAPVGGGGGMAIATGDSPNLEFLLDIKLNVTFEVGRAKMLISDLLTLGQGSVIELHRLVGDELDLLVNGRLIAKGEVVVINEKFGCKITNIISPEERVKHMGGM